MWVPLNNIQSAERGYEEKVSIMYILMITSIWVLTEGLLHFYTNFLIQENCS